MYNDLVRSIIEVVSDDKPVLGLVGGEGLDGEYAIHVEDDPTLIYVRILDGDVQVIIQAINLSVPPQPDFPVIVYYKNKQAYAVADPERSNDYRGGNEGISTVPPHSHEPDFGNFDVVSTRRMREGQVLVTQPYSMSVTCSPFKYWDINGNEQYFYSDTVDLTSFVPTTGQHIYIKIYLDILTALLGAEAGEAKPIVVQLTEEDIINIELLPTQMPLAVVLLDGNMTVIDDDKRIIDWRFWIQSQSTASSAIELILTDENGDVLSDENGDVLMEG